MPSKQRITVDSPATYELRLQGRLDRRWSEFLSSAEIRTEDPPDESPVTVITGRFQDQAALAGALSLLYDLGLPLLSVECLHDLPSEPGPASLAAEEAWPAQSQTPGNPSSVIPQGGRRAHSAE